jgi:hypothetical protein
MTAKRTDANQADIIAALRQVGAKVVSLHEVGGGVPDLLVAFRGRNHLIEIKTTDGKLNKRQENWRANWPAPVAIARTIGDALTAIGIGIEA